MPSEEIKSGETRSKFEAEGGRTGTRTSAVDLLDAGKVAVAGLVDADLRPRLEHPQQPRHQPLRHRRFRLCLAPARWNRSPLPPLRRLRFAGTGPHRPLPPPPLAAGLRISMTDPQTAHEATTTASLSCG